MLSKISPDHLYDNVHVHVHVHVCVFYKHSCCSEILGAMQDPDAGVSLGSHVRNGAVHKNCFTGKTQSLFKYFILNKLHVLMKYFVMWLLAP